MKIICKIEASVCVASAMHSEGEEGVFTCTQSEKEAERYLKTSIVSVRFIEFVNVLVVWFEMFFFVADI